MSGCGGNRQYRLCEADLTGDLHLIRPNAQTPKRPIPIPAPMQA
jgi:hypothetical protein